MKVLDVTEFYSKGAAGVRSHLALKSQVLCRLGHQHVVVAPGGSDSDEEVAYVGGRLARPGGGARVIRVGGPASPYDPTYHLLLRFDKIAGIVARERPDVLEVHSPYLAALGVMRAKRAHYGVRTFQWHSDFIDTYAGVLGAKLARDLPMLGGRDLVARRRHRHPPALGPRAADRRPVRRHARRRRLAGEEADRARGPAGRSGPVRDRARRVPGRRPLLRGPARAPGARLARHARRGRDRPGRRRSVRDREAMGRG